MSEDRPEIRGWLSDALSRRTRHPVLEDTLFRHLQELEHGPLEQLGDLVHNVIEELRVAQRRLAEQAADLRVLHRAVATLSERLDGMTAPAEPPVEEQLPVGHVLLLSGDGYRLVERDGSAPAPGDPVEVDGGEFVVLRGGASPLPGDARPCVLALPR